MKRRSYFGERFQRILPRRIKSPKTEPIIRPRVFASTGRVYMVDSGECVGHSYNACGKFRAVRVVDGERVYSEPTLRYDSVMEALRTLCEIEGWELVGE